MRTAAEPQTATQMQTKQVAETGVDVVSSAVPGFTRDYGVNRLMWFEQHGTMDEAILREKRLKKWNRAWKISMIEELNPHWDDLAIGLGFERLPDHATPRVTRPNRT